jgi:2-polyprenyl-6-hydroxyphenyl methylase/3-demethylubiquinone-9 3-methyltransferase
MSTSRDDPLAPPGALTRWMAGQRVDNAVHHIRPRVLDVGCGSTAPLAAHFQSGEYVGMEPRRPACAKAATIYPQHTFYLPEDMPADARFTTVASLAVLEHVPDPKAFVAELASYLEPHGTLVLTTPHPASDKLHEIGGRLKLFSSRAQDDHEELLGRNALVDVIESAGFRVRVYKRFMFGMNQLVVADRKS